MTRGGWRNISWIRNAPSILFSEVCLTPDVCAPRNGVRFERGVALIGVLLCRRVPRMLPN